jgi:uncharacterized protein
LHDWGPGIAAGVIVAQLAAPHIRGSLMTGIFAPLCLSFAARFAFPKRFGPMMDQPTTRAFHNVAGAAIGLCSGLAGVGGGTLTNIVMTITGMPMRKSIGRAAAGVVVGLPATFVAAFAAWFGARLAQRIAGESLSRIMAVALLATGAVMLHSSVTGR